MSESGDTKWFALDVNTKSVEGKEDIVEYDFAWFLGDCTLITKEEMKEMIVEQNAWRGKR